jgi:hypothetical protein
MIELKKGSKVFIFAPSNAVTGGQECLHQLCDELNVSGKDAYIVYFPDNLAQIPNDYLKYNIKVALEVEDSKENVLVLFESIFNRINDYKNIQKVFWWLSVDHFFSMSKQYLSIWDYLFKMPKLLPWLIIWRSGHLLKNKKNYFLNNISIKKFAAEKDIVHCYQSMYANHFLLKNHFTEIYPLLDFINDEFCDKSTFSNKENIILYNPKKGLKITKTLIKNSPELKWVPLVNMTRTEVGNTLRKGKLYIDFGYHPGKDKIPREAAISGCCILTGLQGSAKYFEDIPIPLKYKKDEKDFNPKEIINEIHNIMNNYDSVIKDFEAYHKIILESRLNFKNQVSKIFS